MLLIALVSISIALGIGCVVDDLRSPAPRFEFQPDPFIAGGTA